MRNAPRRASGEDDHDAANRQTMSLAALAVVLLIVVACLSLVRVLKHESRVEDCLLSGRTDCAEIVPQR